MRLLFHKTSHQHLLNFLMYGGLKTCDLFLNDSESKYVHELCPALSNKLYYMSFARSLLSEYIESGFVQVLIHVKTDFIKNYGKLVPFHYHNIGNIIHNPDKPDNVDEMEERLCTDSPLIPLAAIHHVDIMVERAIIEGPSRVYGSSQFIYSALFTQLVRLGINFRCFQNKKALMRQKNELDVAIESDHIQIADVRVNFVDESEIKPEADDHSKAAFNFWFNDVVPTDFQEVCNFHAAHGYSIPGKYPVFNMYDNFVTAQNLETWHKIRVESRRRGWRDLSDHRNKFSCHITKLKNQAELGSTATPDENVDCVDWGATSSGDVQHSANVETAVTNFLDLVSNLELDPNKTGDQCSHIVLDSYSEMS